MSKLVMISGIPGSGKSSTADTLVEAMQPAVKVYTDEMRHQVSPYAVPWTKLGQEQLRIAIDAVCAVAKIYLENGYNVIMNDVLIQDVYEKYEGFLDKYDGLSVLLNPPLDVALARDRAREEHVPEEHIAQLHAQFNPDQFDMIIDNSELTLEAVVQRIVSKLNS